MNFTFRRRFDFFAAKKFLMAINFCQKCFFFRFLQRPGKVEKFGRADQTQNYSQSFMIEVFSDTFIRKFEE